MISNEAMSNALAMSVAKEAIAKMDEDSRNEFLTRAVASAMKGWDFKRAVEDQVAKHASAAATELLASPEWQERIRNLVRYGAEVLCEMLPKATFETLADGMAGKVSDSSYNTTSMMRKRLNWPDAGEKNPAGDDE